MRIWSVPSIRQAKWRERSPCRVAHWGRKTAPRAPSVRVAGFFRNNRQAEFLGSAKKRELGVAGGADVTQQAVKIIDTRHRLACERNDDIAFAQPRSFRGAIGLSGEDDDAGLLGEVVVADQAPVNGNSLGRHADVA